MLEPYTSRCKYLPVYGANLPLYRSLRHRAGSAEAQRTALRSRGHAPRPTLSPDASAPVALISPVLFAAMRAPTRGARKQKGQPEPPFPQPGLSRRRESESHHTISGTISSATMLMILISGLIAGPAVSL